MAQKKFLFFVERPLHIPVLKPVWTYILEKDLGEVGLYLHPAQTGFLLESLSNHKDVTLSAAPTDLVIADPFSWQPDLTFLADHSYQWVEGLGRLVHIGHGTISKGYYFLQGGRSRRENWADMHCVPGQVHKQMLTQAIFKPVVVTGMPKLDALTLKPPNRSDFINVHGLQPDWPIILLAPTFNPELSLLPFLPDNLRSIVPAKSNLLIKLHGQVSDANKKRFAQFAINDKAAHLIGEDDVTPYLGLADVLISDVSSVIYEFLSMKKPVVLFDSPRQKSFLNYDARNLEYIYRNIGTRVEKPSQLKTAVIKVLKKPPPSPSRVRVAQAFLFSRKKESSSERVVQASLSLLQKKQSECLVFRVGKENGSRPGWEKHLGSDFEMCSLPPLPGTFFPWKTLREKLKTFKGHTVILIDAGLQPGPGTFSLLHAHCQTLKRLGAIGAVVCDTASNSRLQPFTLGIQSGYALAGESLKLDKFPSGCLAFPLSSLKRFLASGCNDRLSRMKDMAEFLLRSGKEFRLALDSCVYPPAMEEKLDRAGNPQAEVVSYFENLIHLQSPNLPPRFLDQMIVTYKRCHRTWTVTKQINLLVDLGAAFAKTGYNDKAVGHLEQAHHTKTSSPNLYVQCRLAYYLGLCYSEKGDKVKGKRYLRACLKLMPEHKMAKKLMLRLGNGK